MICVNDWRYEVTRRNPEILCQVCGQFHGSADHGSADHVSGERVSFSSLNAANYNVPVQIEPKSRKRLTAQEAMALTKERYKETLEYLT